MSQPNVLSYNHQNAVWVVRELGSPFPRYTGETFPFPEQSSQSLIRATKQYNYSIVYTDFGRVELYDRDGLFMLKSVAPDTQTAVKHLSFRLDTMFAKNVMWFGHKPKEAELLYYRGKWSGPWSSDKTYTAARYTNLYDALVALGDRTFNLRSVGNNAFFRQVCDKIDNRMGEFGKERCAFVTIGKQGASGKLIEMELLDGNSFSWDTLVEKWLARALNYFSINLFTVLNSFSPAMSRQSYSYRYRYGGEAITAEQAASMPDIKFEEELCLGSQVGEKGTISSVPWWDDLEQKAGR